MKQTDIDILILRSERVANRLAGSDVSRREDLRQEAALGALSALDRRGFDDTRGSFGGFVERCGWNRAVKLSWRMSSVASTGSNGDLPKLAETSRCDVADIDESRFAVNTNVEHAQLATLLHTVISRGRHADAVAEVLLHEKSVREVARVHAKHEADLRAAVAETKDALRKDRRLREFARIA